MTDEEIITKILSIKGIGPAIARTLVSKLESELISNDHLTDYLFSQKETIPRLKLDKTLIKTGFDKADYIISKSRELGISFMTLQSPFYPNLLKGIPDPPLVLSYIGNVEILHQDCVAIVGSREASTFGKSRSFEFAKLSSIKGFAVVSGLAKGIDSFAHSGCLEAKGKTIAVLGNGLDSNYPSENKQLVEGIINSGGLLISECFIGEKANAGSLLLRNRIIVGISNQLIVIQTELKSGTMRTAKLALENNRDVGCSTYLRDDRPGNLALLMNPKVVGLRESVDVVEFLRKSTN